MTSLDLQEALSAFEEEPITRQMMMGILKDYKRPNDKISEMLASNMLLPIKKGFYQPGSQLRLKGPHPFLIANVIYGPSYISMDSAMSYWGMIPERVFETSSMTTERNKQYDTPSGRFVYSRVDLPYYTFGIQRVKLSERQAVLIASPEKALCDKITTTSGIMLRSEKQTRALLLDDLRIGSEWLEKLSPDTIYRWASAGRKKTSLEMLAQTLDNSKT
jgi:hypothetical protein